MFTEQSEKEKEKQAVIVEDKPMTRSKAILEAICCFVLIGVVLTTFILLTPVLNKNLVPFNNINFNNANYRVMLSLPTESKIDVAVLGTSRSMDAFNTKKLSDETGKFWFNASVWNQSLEERVFFINEMYRMGHRPELFMVEVGAGALYGRDINRRESILKYVETQRSGGILANMLHEFAPWLGFTRNIMKPKARARIASDRQAFGIQDGFAYLLENHGYFPRATQNETMVWNTYNIRPGGTSQNITNGDIFDGENICDSFYESIEKIIETVNAKNQEYNTNAKVVLYNTPRGYFNLMRQPAQFQLYVEFMNDYATDLGVSYYDFSLARNDKFNHWQRPTQASRFDHYYLDFHHLSKTGADAFAPYFINFYNDVIVNEGDPLALDYLLEDVYKVLDDASYVYYATMDWDATYREINIGWVAGNAIKDNLEFRVVYRFGDTEFTLQDWNDGAKKTWTEAELVSHFDGKRGAFTIEVQVREKDGDGGIDALGRRDLHVSRHGTITR